MKKRTPILIASLLVAVALGTFDVASKGALRQQVSALFKRSTPVVEVQKAPEGEVAVVLPDPPRPEAPPETAKVETPKIEEALPSTVTEVPKSNEQLAQEQVAAAPEPAAEPVAEAAAPQPEEQSAVPEPATETQVAVAQPKPTAEPAAPKEQGRLTTAPAFDTVRVEPTGEAVIAGRAEPGAEVIVKFGEVVVGETIATADGSFVIVPDQPLPEGSGALTLETLSDGKIVASEEAIAIAISKRAPALVAKVTPAKPTQLVQTPGEPTKDVQLNAVDYDEAGNVVFQGRAKGQAIVRFYIDNDINGEVTADANGQWVFKSEAQLEPGKHTLRVDEVDTAGKVLSRMETPFLRETAEKVVASAEPQPDPNKVEVVKGVEGAPARIVIQPGNSLWKISREVYGKGNMYTVIFEANRDLIKDANRVYPGQILTAPTGQP